MRPVAMMKVALVGVLCAFGVATAAEKKQGDVNVLLEAGVGDYTGGLSNYTSAGPSWGVIVNLQPSNVIGWEIGYAGSRNMLETDVAGISPALTRNGAHGMVKLGLPFIEKVKPFAGVGFGASYASVSEEGGGLYQSDFMEEIPFAAGLEFNTGALTAGVRASYHWLIDEGFADPAALGNPEGGFMDATLNIGARF